MRRLYITDGTTTVFLIDDNPNGFKLDSWRPSVSQYKDGGLFQESPLSDGRRLINTSYSAAVETFNLKIRGNSVDDGIKIMRDLRKLLIAASQYWVDTWNNSPVYIVAQAACESEERYAIVVTGQIVEDENPYAQPFRQVVGSVWDNITLVVERAHWQADFPRAGRSLGCGNLNTFDSEAYGTTRQLPAKYIYSWNGSAWSQNFQTFTISGTNVVWNLPQTWLNAASPAGSRVWFGFDKPIDYMEFFLSNSPGVNLDWYITDNTGVVFSQTLAPVTSSSSIKLTLGGAPTTANFREFNLRDVAGTPQQPPDASAYWAIAELAAPSVAMFQEDFYPVIGTRKDEIQYTKFGGEQDDWISCFVQNSYTPANITHIFHFDNSTGLFSSNLLPTGNAVPIHALFPTGVGPGDILYFGIDTSVTDASPFFSLVFDLRQDTSLMQPPTLTGYDWEYRASGFVWSGLAELDNTLGLTEQGLNSVHWEPKSNQVITVINGVTGWWVRYLPTMLGPVARGPLQQNRFVYAATQPHYEISEDELLGDIPSLFNSFMYGRSGHFTTHPALAPNRIYVGSRETSRGANFNAFINASDAHNVTGLTTSIFAPAFFETSSYSHVGRRVRIDYAASSTLFSTIFSVSFSPSIVQQWYGEYHMFARVGYAVSLPPNPTTGDFAFRYITFDGSTVTEGKSTEPFIAPAGPSNVLEYYHLVDLGRLTFYPSSATFGRLAQFDIRFQVKPTNGINKSILLYDLVLLPVDGSIAATISATTPGTGIIGYNGNDVTFLHWGSIVDAKNRLTATKEETDSTVTASYYTLSAIPKFVMEPDATHRLWVLADKTFTDGNSQYSMAQTSLAISTSKTDRFLSMVGDTSS